MDIQAPYEPGTLGPILVGGDNDAGGRDIVSSTVDGAKANALARAAECAADTYAQGSAVGDMFVSPGAWVPGATQPGEAAIHDFDL